MKILFVSISASDPKFEVGEFVFCKIARNKWRSAKVIKVGKSITCQFYDKDTDTFSPQDLTRNTKERFNKLKDAIVDSTSVKHFNRFIPEDFLHSDIPRKASEAYLLKLLGKEKTKLGSYLYRDSVRLAVMEHPNATKNVLKLGLEDSSSDRIRSAAMLHRNATPELLMLGAKDPSYVVRKSAMENYKATPKILMLGAKDSDYEVRRAAMANENATPEILMIGARSENVKVRAATMRLW